MIRTLFTIAASAALVALGSTANAEGPRDTGGDPGDPIDAPPQPRPEAATPPVAASAPKAEKPVSLRVDGGYSPRTLVALPLTGADVGLAFGAQPRRHLAIWGSSRLLLGSTENGLDVVSLRLGGEVEGVLGRLRLGAGAHLFGVGVGRVTRDRWIVSWGPAASVTARLDLIQSDGFALFARAAIDAGYELYNGTIFWGPTVGGGVDFDLAGSRAALK